MAQAPLTLLVLGSGAFAPGPNERGRKVRNPAGYAVETPEGVLLFDFGFGNLRQLFRAGRQSREVTHAFFTHRHPDHCADLAALLFHLHYDAKPTKGELRVYGPEGFKAFIDRLSRAYEPWLEPKGFKLTVSELSSGDKVEGPGWTVACRAVPHPTPAIAYRLDSPKGSFCYTGDTGWDPGLAEFAKEAGVFVVECTLPDRARYKGHLRVSEALKLAKASRAKRVLLSHLSEEAGKEARRRVTSRIKLARDLQRVRLA